jgi:hypothetical protein|tara:strand:- start:1383 stop:1493 length:111 start_codon:yes stop_codon:yes gene_type:complete
MVFMAPAVIQLQRPIGFGGQFELKPTIKKAVLGLPF